MQERRLYYHDIQHLQIEGAPQKSGHHLGFLLVAQPEQQRQRLDARKHGT